MLGLLKLKDLEWLFASEQDCHAHLVALRWPEGVRCPACDGRKTSEIKPPAPPGTQRTPERTVYECRFCLRQFTVTSGTAFQDTHLPLSKWFRAVEMWIDSGGKLKARALERELGVTYRTAWLLRQKLKSILKDFAVPKPKSRGAASSGS
jgi:transposase-like protein